jgi:hypothetical protein
MPAFCTACSRCCDSKARLDLPWARVRVRVRARTCRRVGALEDEDKLAARKESDLADMR